MRPSSVSREQRRVKSCRTLSLSRSPLPSCMPRSGKLSCCRHSSLHPEPELQDQGSQRHHLPSHCTGPPLRTGITPQPESAACKQGCGRHIHFQHAHANSRFRYRSQSSSANWHDGNMRQLWASNVLRLRVPRAPPAPGAIPHARCLRCTWSTSRVRSLGIVKLEQQHESRVWTPDRVWSLI